MRGDDRAAVSSLYATASHADLMSAYPRPHSPSLGLLRHSAALPRHHRHAYTQDVVNAEQARIAEEAGACAVMALERVPADIRVEGGVARMSDPKLIQEIIEAVSIPVMAKCRIGHFVEAQILQSLNVDYIDESEVLTPADDEHHINKHNFKVPFVCGCRNLGEALRRISEGVSTAAGGMKAMDQALTRSLPLFPRPP